VKQRRLLTFAANLAKTESLRNASCFGTVNYCRFRKLWRIRVFERKCPLNGDRAPANHLMSVAEAAPTWMLPSVGGG
jgi:hypothetical protein